jgi:hypothetical protein
MLAHVITVLRRATPIAGWLFLFGPLSCTASAHLRKGVVYDQPVVYVERAPARIRHYPRYYYRGRPAYLVKSRWYYDTPRGWVVFREEPRELRRFRRDRVESGRDYVRPRMPRDRRNLYRHHHRERGAVPGGSVTQSRRRLRSD